MFDVLNPLFKDVNISPIADVKLRTISTTLPKAPELNTLAIAPPINSSPFLAISITENKPLKVLFNLSAVSSLIFSLDVSFSNPSVKLSSCFAVTGGNISLKASLIGVTMLTKPLKILLNDSINLVRPPKSAHSCTTLFRASELLLIISFRVLLTEVHIVRASSKSPIMVLQVSVQPEPNASFNVSINCENVLTLVAASPAVLAISAICFASS